MKRFFLLCTIAFALLTSSAIAQDSTGNASAGRQTFTTICVACHAVGKQVIGPDLKGVYNLRTQEWIIKFVHGSQALIKSGDTAAVNIFNQFNKVPMPDNGNMTPLTDKDVINVIAYIRQQSDSLDQAAAAAPASATAISDVTPYKETGALHRLIFLDEPGSHMPLTFGDYGAWLALVVAVIVLAVVLVMIVKMQDLKEKSRSVKDDEDDTV